MQLLQELDWLSEADVAQRLTEVLDRQPSLARDVELAILYVASRRFDQAANFAESAFNAAPEDPYAAYMCGVVRVQQRDWERALEALLKIPIDFERASEVAALCAVSLLELNRTSEADRMAQSYPAVDDDTRGTLSALRARCAVSAGDLEAARTLFNEALLYAPKLDWVRKARALLPQGSSAAEIAAVVI